MRRTAIAFWIPLLLLAGACTPRLTAPRVRDVVISVGPREVRVNAPAFIGAGDSLRVRVQDSAYVNRYLARDTAVTLTAMDATAMSGDTTLKVMSLAFAPSRIPGSAQVTVPSAVVPQTAGQRSALRGLLESSGTHVRRPTRAERAYAALLDSIQAENDLLKTAADTMGRVLELLRGRLRTDRSEHARVTLLHDTTWFEAAGRMLNDSGLHAADRLLVSLTSAAPPTLTPDSLYAYRRRFEEYGRRLDVFRALLPTEPPTALSDTSSVPSQLERVAQFSVIYNSVFARRAPKEARALLLARQINGATPIPPAPRRPDLVVLGMDLSGLLASPAHLQERMATARLRLDSVNRGTVRVVTAANQLPRWTVTGEAATILTSVYPTEKEVKVVVTRRNRFAPWSTGATVAAASPSTATKPASTTTTSSGGTTITTVTTVTPAGTEKKEESGGSSSGGAGTAPVTGMPLVVVPRTDDTVAMLTIPVLQRYRFRLGVGMAFSQLETTAIETVPGAVDGDSGVYVLHKGINEHRFIPVALLSMTVLPWEGRYVDGRARRYPWSNPSLSLQGGVSLQSPTEQLYAGLAIEPLPGLEVGAGWHWAYVETTGQPSGAFVERSQGSATSKQWLNDLAFSFTLDATTFVRAFGGLLGL